MRRVSGVQEAVGVEDVEAGGDSFLERENGLLDSLHDLHGMQVTCLVSGDEAKLENDNRGVHQEAVDKDHDQHSAQDARVVNDKVKPRPQHDGEASHVGHPADLTDDCGQNGWTGVSELFDEIAAGL